MKKRNSFLFTILLAGLFSSVSAGEGARAFAKIEPLQGSKVKGTVSFIQQAGGTRIVADIEGLAPGAHGFHIHESGDCSSPDGSSAKGHYNPYQEKHGGHDSIERHVGDLGNIIADPRGRAHLDVVASQLLLEGPTSVVGRSILIHEKEDDLKTDPAGDSGKRIACGKIIAIPAFRAP